MLMLVLQWFYNQLINYETDHYHWCATIFKYRSNLKSERYLFLVIFSFIYNKKADLPKNSEMIPTEEEESMPPTEKMATESDHRDVRVCKGICSAYLSIHVELYSCSMIWGQIDGETREDKTRVTWDISTPRKYSAPYHI